MKTRGWIETWPLKFSQALLSQSRASTYSRPILTRRLLSLISQVGLGSCSISQRNETRLILLMFKGIFGQVGAFRIILLTDCLGIFNLLVLWVNLPRNRIKSQTDEIPWSVLMSPLPQSAQFLRFFLSNSSYETPTRSSHKSQMYRVLLSTGLGKSMAISQVQTMLLDYSLTSVMGQGWLNSEWR
jgi:hypothetical protein